MTIQELKIRSIDLETTDTPENGGQVLEVGYTDLWYRRGKPLEIDHPASFYVDPGCDISYEAMATHHIIPEDLDGAPLFSEKETFVHEWSDVFAAHNIDFEKEYIITEKPWICTLRASRRAFPNLHRHDLQYLRYALHLDCNRNLARPPHRAAPDSYICAILIDRLLDEYPIKLLLEWSTMQALVPICHFKKYKGTPWKEVVAMAPDYAQWVLQQPDMPDDIKYTCAYWLRGGDDE